MYFLEKDSKEEKESLNYIEECKKEALKATCKRSKCGSVIVKDNEIIGRGYNSAPANLDSQVRCDCDKDSYNKKVTDKTCCIHAEQRAIMDALKNNPNKISGSILYFIRLDKDNNIIHAGKPYCTICSKMSLDVGIAEFVLYHENSICIYDSEEYNDLSFKYSG